MSIKKTTFTLIVSLSFYNVVANSAIINFTPGTPSHNLNGASLNTTPGTINIGEVASYVSGGSGLIGRANTWPIASTSAIAGSEIGDHQWIQGDPAILFKFGLKLNEVAGISGVDHGPLPNEALEWIVWGSNAAGDLLEEGAIKIIYDDGVDPAAGVLGESDDFSSVWGFSSDYDYFAVTSGTHIAGFNSPNEFEIDGLAAVVPIPAAFWLFSSGLLGIISIARKFKAT